MTTISPSPVVLRSRRLDRHAAERLATLLESLLWPPAAAVTVLQGDAESDWWTVEAIFTTTPQESDLAHGLEMAGLDDSTLVAVTLPEIDWVGATLEQLAPVRAGRFLIHGSHDRRRRPPARIAIEIDAGTAFGTGHHGTTLGCLLALDHLLKGQRPRRVLDIGSGSGVLAIAAALASHALVSASDIDPEAVRVTRQNARLNGARVAAWRAAGAGAQAIRAGAPYDVILANILARPLAALSGELRKMAAAGGTVVLSGLQHDQERWVTAAYRGHGFRLIRRIRLDGWSTLVLQAPASRPSCRGVRPRPSGGSRPAAGRYRPGAGHPGPRARARPGTG
jgi:ribosomal protein L11 methyltransferase